MEKGTNFTQLPGIPVGLNQIFKAMLAIATCSLFVGCGEEELTEWQLFAQDAGKEIAGLETQITSLETKFESLGKKWEEQIGKKEKFYGELEKNVGGIASLVAEIRNLEEKHGLIQEAIGKNEPYTGKTGQVYKPADMEQLTKDVVAEIAKKKAEVVEKRKYAEGFERYAAGSWEHQSQADLSKKELQSQFSALRAQYDKVVDIKGHVELVKEIKEEVGQEYNVLKTGVEESIKAVDGKLKANQELLDSFMGQIKKVELGKTLKDF